MKDSRDFEKYVWTDLACESGKISPEDFRHAKYEAKEEGSLKVERLEVGSDEASAETGKEVGSYVTISGDALKDVSSDPARLGEAVARELVRLAEAALGKKIGLETKVLVAGLGNRFITPDALGSRCADKINATRHVAGDSLFKRLGCSSVAVISTGVLGQTGIETSEHVAGIARGIRPDLVVVIDSMAARKTDRLASTIQLSDTGIAPGKGIGKARCAIDKTHVGCPVIGIGSPTVVSSSTLIHDALDAAGIETLSPSLTELLDGGRNFFVSQSDSDAAVERLSDIISCGVNIAFGTSFLT